MLGKKIRLAPEHYEMARKYAEATWSLHVSCGRDPQRVWQNVFLGKQGEIAYCIINELDLSLLNFDEKGGVDNGWDLEHDGVKIDVKTKETPFYRVNFNMSYVRCDTYAIMAKNPATGEFAHIVSMDKCLALKRAKDDHGLWFWDFRADLDIMKHCGYIADLK